MRTRPSVKVRTNQVIRNVLPMIAAAAILTGCGLEPERKVAAGRAAAPKSTSRSVGSVLDVRAEAEEPLEIPSGTVIPVQLVTRLNLDSARPGHKFQAELRAPVVAGNKVVFPKGSRAVGRVINATDGDRPDDYLMLELQAVQSIRGEWIPLQTSSVVARGHKSGWKRNSFLFEPSLSGRDTRRKFSFGTTRPVTIQAR